MAPSSQELEPPEIPGRFISPAGVELAMRRFPEVKFIAADITAWRPEQCFDLVVSSEVLEHLVEKEAFVKTIDHILKPGGWLVLTTPNKLVKKYWDKGNQGGEQILEDWVSPGELRKLFKGYKILHQSTFYLDFSYCDKFRWLTSPKLLRFFERLHVRDLYDLVRAKVDLGLYQVLLCQKENIPSQIT